MPVEEIRKKYIDMRSEYENALMKYGSRCDKVKTHVVVFYSDEYIICPNIIFDEYGNASVNGTIGLLSARILPMAAADALSTRIYNDAGDRAVSMHILDAIKAQLRNIYDVMSVIEEG